MITAFYSYTPGVGCTMASVNIAILLCKEFRKRVLLVDWNFATPKLLMWMESISQSPTATFINLLSEYKSLIEGEQPISTEMLPLCRNFANPTAIPGLDFLPVSSGSELDNSTLASFDWAEFYADYNGGAIIEHIRNQWSQAYDIVIVISEKGMSDAASVCTLQVADVVVLMMSMNNWEIKAAEMIAQSIRNPELKRDGRPINVLPVPSKTSLFEAELRQKLREYLRAMFSQHLPYGINATDYFSGIEIPAIPYYEMSHEIAVLHEPLARPQIIVESYREIVKRLLTLAPV